MSQIKTKNKTKQQKQKTYPFIMTVKTCIGNSAFPRRKVLYFLNISKYFGLILSTLYAG